MRRRRWLLAGLLPLWLAACRPSATAVPGARKVLFVGLDGADWQLLDRFVAAGAMPNLARLAREGRTGVLTTLQPPLSPLVWTTMMTGVGPLRHGILDFTRRDPATCAVEPIRSEDRRAPALWNIATARQRSVAVFGLWATYPAEPVDGLLISDRFLSFTSRSAPRPDGGGLAPGVVYPTERAAWAAKALAETDAALDTAALQAYLPGLSPAEAEAARGASDPYAHPASALRKILLETRTYHRLATEWIRERHPDLALVYFQGTDTLGHVFAPYAPPRQATISEEDSRRYSEVPERYFGEVDRMLGDYRKLAEEEGALLVLASDHGFLWGEGRPRQLSSAAAPTAGRWHRSEGIYLLWGPGAKPAAERSRGSVEQLAATLLAALGLPAGKGMGGPPLPGLAFQAQPEADYGATFKPAPQPHPEFDSAGGDRDPQSPATGPASATETVENLRALGYIAGREGGAGGAGKEACPAAPRTPGSFNNEGLLLRAQGDLRAAAKAFRRALDTDSDNVSALWNLSELLFAEGRELDRADQMLLRARDLGLPEGVEQIAGRAVEYGRRKQEARAVELLDGAIGEGPGTPELLLLRGRFELGTRRCREAAADFSQVIGKTPNDAVAHASLGLARLCLGDADGAAQALRRSLEIDPNQAQVRAALNGLGG